MSKTITIDTNLLLDDSNVINKLATKYDCILIPRTVLKELDKHKYNPDLSYSARNAITSIRQFKEEFPEKIKFYIQGGEINNNDAWIIQASKENNADLATKDISMSIIAEAEGLNSILYDVVLNNIYQPYNYINIEDIYKHYETAELDNFYGREISEYHEGLDFFSKVLDKELNKDGWFFIFVNHGHDVTVYANNPIKKHIIRIDHKPEYNTITCDNRVKIEARDIYQNCAIFAFREAPNVLLTGKWGSGKSLLSSAYSVEDRHKKAFISRPPVGINAKYEIGFLPGPQPVDCKILTPTGWRKMGDLKEGDYVIGRDGKKTKILNVFDKGNKPVFKIKTTNGGETEACGDHLWAVKNRFDLRNNKDYRLLSTKQIMDDLYVDNDKSKYNYTLPKNDIVNFESNEELPIPPYTLGVLLGDGHMGSNTTISGKDYDIIERVEMEIKKFGLYINNNNFDYNLVGNYTSNKPSKRVVVENINTNKKKIYSGVREASENIGVNKSIINSRCKNNIIINDDKFYFIEGEKFQHPIRNELYKLGLYNSRSHTKFIPDVYKYTTIENRIAILQGLMDTDGTIRKSNGEQSYTTTSKQLCLDVIEVCRSLGINATYYIRKHDEPNIKDSYEVYLPKSNIQTFHTERKKCYLKPPNKYQHNIKIKKIEYLGEKHVKCIRIDNIDNLYITDDYIVTHNSKEDKMLDWLGGFTSSLYYIYGNTNGQRTNGNGYNYVKDEVFDKKFEVLPLNSIQGLSLLEDDLMIIDEIQLVSVDYMSMILSRPSENGKLILLGDLKQTYNIVKPSESGLLKLLRILPHESMAFVNLENSYRSNIIQLADKLQDKTIE